MAGKASALLAEAEAQLTDEDCDKAMKTASTALTLFKEQGDEAGVADASRIMIHTLIHQGQCQEGAMLAKEEWGRYQSAGDKLNEAKMALAIAEASVERRTPKGVEEGLSRACEALEAFRKLGNKPLQAKTQLCIINAHLLSKGCAEEALTAAGQARELFRELGDKRGEANALHGVATAQVEIQGAWLAPAEEAAQLFQQAGLRKMEAWERCCIAQWHLQQSPRKALRAAGVALTLSREVGALDHEATALGTLVAAHLAIKDVSKEWMHKEATLAAKVAKEGARRFQSKGHKAGEGQALTASVLALVRKGEPKQALKAAEQARAIFEALGDSASESLLLRLLSQLQLQQQQLVPAMQNCSKAGQLAKGDDEKFSALRESYELQLHKGDFRSAIALADQLHSLGTPSNVKRRGVALLLKANAHYLSQQYTEALKVAREAQALFQDHDEVEGEAESLRIIAEVHVASNDFWHGLRVAERCRRLQLEANDPEGEAVACFLAARIRLMILVEGRGELLDPRLDLDFAQECAEALEYAEEASALASRSGGRRLEASALCLLAQVLTAARECDRAFTTTDEALAIFREEEDFVAMASVMCLEADVHLADESPKRAVAVANKALAIFRKHGDTRGEAVALGIIDHITGPQEEVLAPQPDYSEEEWNQWQLEMWKEQESQQQQQEQQIQPQQPQEQAVAKKRAPRTDTGEKLSTVALNEETVTRRLFELVRLTADLDDDEEMEFDRPLMQMGITSKSAVAMRSALQEELPGMYLPMTLVFDYPTINDMTQLVLEEGTGGRR